METKDKTRFNFQSTHVHREVSAKVTSSLCVLENFQVKLLSDHLEIGFDGAANLTFGIGGLLQIETNESNFTSSKTVENNPAVKPPRIDLKKF